MIVFIIHSHQFSNKYGVQLNLGCASTAVLTNTKSKSRHLLSEIIVETFERKMVSFTKQSPIYKGEKL